jgi:hypothetical protein
MRIAARIVLIILQWVLGIALVTTIGRTVERYFGESFSEVIFYGSLFGVAMYWSWQLRKFGKRREDEQPPAECAAIRFEPNARKLQRK